MATEGCTMAEMAILVQPSHLTKSAANHTGGVTDDWCDGHTSFLTVPAFLGLHIEDVLPL